MEIEELLRALSSVMHRAWYRCESPNLDVLAKLSFAFQEVAEEHRVKREDAAEHTARMEALRVGQAAEEAEILARRLSTGEPTSN